MTDVTTRAQPTGQTSARAIARKVAHELHVCWSFSSGDLTATVLPATLFAVAGWLSADGTSGSLPLLLIQCLGYFWLYIYTFNLSNQLVGIDEDRVNKPHRPLITGLVSPSGAWRRLCLTTMAFVVLGLALGVLVWSVLWIVAWISHNHLGGARTVWGKNAAMVAGTIAQLAAAWQIATPLNPTAWTWILSIAAPLAVLVSLQDLRDITGDTAIGRRTAVTVFGERTCRQILSSAFAAYPALLYFVLYREAVLIPTMLGGVAALLCYAISYRVVRFRTRRADNLTYLLYTYWYCVTLLSVVTASVH